MPRRIPYLSFVCALLLLARVVEAGPLDHCEPAQTEGLAWRTTSGCEEVPLDHENPQGEKIRIYYELNEPRDSLGNLIFFHGGPAFPKERLSQEGLLWQSLRAHYRVLYFHQRGSGWSGRIATEEELEGRRHLYTLDATVRDSEILWERLLHREKVTVIGKSAGGFLALEFALRHPEAVAALVVACTSADHVYVSERNRVKREFLEMLEQRHPGFQDTYEKALSVVSEERAPGLSGLADVVVNEGTVDSVVFDLSYTLKGQFEIVAIIRELAEERFDLLMQRLARGQQNVRYTGLESLPVLNSITCREFGYGRANPAICGDVKELPVLFDVRARLSGITAPVLVVSGRYDPVLPPEHQEPIVRGVRGPVEWRTMELSGHMVFQEQPLASAAIVLDFLGVPRQQLPQTSGL